MRKLATPLAALCLLVSGLVSAGSHPAGASASGAGPDRAAGHAERRVPTLRVRVVASGLDIPWDVRPIGDGRLLVTQRNSARLTLIGPNGGKRDLGFPSRRVWSRGEVGLLGLAVDPQFSRNRRIYTCQGWKLPGDRKDIRVIAWRLGADLDRVRLVRTLVRGLPTNATGHHGGCRLLIDRAGSLLVGTGDAWSSRTSQNLRSLGGKVLRVDRMTGRAWPTNPWAGADGPRRLVLTYGHRNVQGLAQRSDGSLWSVEHGPDRDDEVNRLRRGGNYGWAPGPNYDQDVPMTDHSLPGRQFGARWRSGYPTVAPSGAAFVRGRGWGSYRGALAVACLSYNDTRGQRVIFMKFAADGQLRWTRSPARLHDFGRLRAVTAYRGSLLITTSNGDGNDRILQVRPAR